MSYRDDTETLRARVDALESELADAKETIARLKGDDRPRVAGRPRSDLEAKLAHPRPVTARRSTRGDEGTHLQLLVDSRGMMMMPFICGFILAMLTLPVMGSLYGPAVLPVALSLAAIVGFVISREIFARYLGAYQARCRGIVEAASAIITEHAQPNVRIAENEDAKVDEEQEEDEAVPAQARR